MDTVSNRMLYTILLQGYNECGMIIVREWNGAKMGLTNLLNAYENAANTAIRAKEHQ